MKRRVVIWEKCNPVAMARQSECAIMYAFQDATSDILKMAEVLRVIGYPRRGTKEETMDIEDIAKYVQTNFSMDDLKSDE